MANQKNKYYFHNATDERYPDYMGYGGDGGMGGMGGSGGYRPYGECSQNNIRID